GDERGHPEEGLAARRRGPHQAATPILPRGLGRGVGSGADGGGRRGGEPTIRGRTRAVLAGFVASRERGRAHRDGERGGEDAGAAMPAHGRVMPKSAHGSKRARRAGWTCVQLTAGTRGSSR